MNKQCWISVAGQMLLVALFVGFVPKVSAQSFRMVRFGVEHGLLSSEVYCALQDCTGFLWFGTDRGAVRYDGYEFRLFSTDEGLPDNTVFQY
ncbi:MAG: hypothetical protein AAF998_14295 [Bacteroidota bacterium]